VNGPALSASRSSGLRRRASEIGGADLRDQPVVRDPPAAQRVQCRRRTDLHRPDDGRLAVARLVGDRDRQRVEHRRDGEIS
jgi:hypothetical protein